MFERRVSCGALLTWCAVVGSLAPVGCGDDASGEGGAGSTSASGTSTGATSVTTASSTSATTASVTGAGGSITGGTGGAGAGGQGGGEGGGFVSEVVGVVSGFRTNEATLEQRVVGALVEVTDGGETWSAVSDGNGVFSIPDVPPGSGYRVKVTVPEEGPDVRFNGDTYGRWHELLTVLDGVPTPLAPRLARGCTTPIDVVADAAQSFVPLGFECGAAEVAGRLAIPEGGLVGTDGEPFSGRAALKLSPLHYPSVAVGDRDLGSVVSMPGDLFGTDGGDAAPIHTFAAADVRVVADETGEELQLAPGAVAELTMRAFRELTDEDEVLSWSFDEEANVWVEEGTCRVDETDAQLVTCEVRHFSWWNADGRSPGAGGGGGGDTTKCVYGGVLFEGEPVVGALVSAITNEGLAGGGDVATGIDGSFCAGSNTDGGWDVQVRMPNDRVVLRGNISVSAQTADEATCSESPDDCAQAGVIELVPDSVITVEGTTELCDAELFPAPPFCGPIPDGWEGWENGVSVRVLGFLPSRTKDFYLGEYSVQADGSFAFDIPAAIDSIILSTTDGYCNTYNMFIPGEGDPAVIVEPGGFICGS